MNPSPIFILSFQDDTLTSKGLYFDRHSEVTVLSLKGKIGMALLILQNSIRSMKKKQIQNIGVKSM